MFSNLLAFVVLFGVLVFVHELGHFLMAKYFKIGVEKFSLGYGPKIFSKRYGGTEYIISALPLGGYVKMVGDEPVDERQAEEEQKELPEDSFLAKPPWQRILVVLMGPVANLVLPIVLVAGLYMIGQPYITTQVGYVAPDSPASEAGLRPGDTILSVAGEKVLKWNEMSKIINSRSGQPTTLVLERLGEAETVTITTTPKEADGQNEFGEKVRVGQIGIDPVSFKPQVAIPNENSAAWAAGLRSGDTIKKVDGVEVFYFWQVAELVERSKNAAIPFIIDRQGEEQAVEINRQLFLIEGEIASLARAGIYHQQLVVDKVLENSVAAEKGIEPGDVLVGLNDKPLFGFTHFQKAMQANRGEEAALTVLRGGETINLNFSPKLVEEKHELTGEKVKQRMLGVSTKGEVRSTLGTLQVLNPFKALLLGVDRCYQITRLTIIGFGKLITGSVSPKSLGGPILIYQLAGNSWKDGLNSFVHMLVLISISLGILNLLPIPVLDGGHLVFYTIEMIQGKPISARTRELAQQVGILLLLCLMIFAFYNDLMRISWSKVGWWVWIKGLFS